MNHRAHQSLWFCIGGGLTLAGWILFWPDQAVSPEPTSPAIPAHARPAAWDPAHLAERIGDLESATTDEARLKAANRLSEIPVAEIPGVLATIKIGEKRNLSLVAKTLLIRWAAADGEAALHWAWNRLRTDHLFDPAFKEIGSSWAWSHPRGLIAWTQDYLERHPLSAAAAPADELALDTFKIVAISKWLAPEYPREACQLLILRQGFSSMDQEVAAALNTVPQIQQALSAFPDLDRMVPNRYQGTQILALELMKRWSEIDPVTFARTPYPAVMPGKSLAEKDRATLAPAEALLRDFIDWKRSNPETPPDMSQWPADRQEAWKDLDTLGLDPRL